MTEFTREKILEKLRLLDEYLKNLYQLRKEIKSEKEFLKDFHFFGTVERYLQLSCQVIIDCLDLIIIEKGLEKPEDRHEVISVVYNAGIISEDLTSKLEGIPGFRNILVHEYGKIDRKRVYKYLREKIDDFEIFKKQILKWLKGRK